MNDDTERMLSESRRCAEDELGMKIPNELAESVANYCKRKLHRIKKGEDYLPILYQCELVLHVQMSAINQISSMLDKQRKEERKSYV